MVACWLSVAVCAAYGMDNRIQFLLKTLSFLIHFVSIRALDVAKSHIPLLLPPPPSLSSSHPQFPPQCLRRTRSQTRRRRRHRSYLLRRSSNNIRRRRRRRTSRRIERHALDAQAARVERVDAAARDHVPIQHVLERGAGFVQVEREVGCVAGI